MSCAKSQFLELSFCGPHAKPHGARGLSKNYHLGLDPKLGHGTCEMRRISCACISCTTMLNTQWDYDIEPNKQTRYQPVVEFTY